MAQVAVLVGVSERLVSTWERGQGLPGLCAAFYLAHALNRQVIDLFFPIHDYARPGLSSRMVEGRQARTLGGFASGGVRRRSDARPIPCEVEGGSGVSRNSW